MKCLRYLRMQESCVFQSRIFNWINDKPQGQGLQEIIACSAFLRYNVDNNVLLQGKERRLCAVLLDMWE